MAWKLPSIQTVQTAHYGVLHRASARIELPGVSLSQTLLPGPEATNSGSVCRASLRHPQSHRGCHKG